jgi:hypothetical protein
MATTYNLTSTGVTVVGENHDRMCGFWIIQVSGRVIGNRIHMDTCRVP